MALQASDIAPCIYIMTCLLSPAQCPFSTEVLWSNQSNNSASRAPRQFRRLVNRRRCSAKLRFVCHEHPAVITPSYALLSSLDTIFGSRAICFSPIMFLRQRLCSSILRPGRNHALAAGRRPRALSFSTSRLRYAVAAEDTSKGVVSLIKHL